MPLKMTLKEWKELHTDFKRKIGKDRYKMIDSNAQGVKLERVCLIKEKKGILKHEE